MSTDLDHGFELPHAIMESVLDRLDLSEKPSADLPGLNSIYGAFCGKIGSDNILKRIWFAGDGTKPLSGGSPEVFFFPGLVRDRPFVFRTEPNNDPVGYDFFVRNYALSASSTRLRSRFNDVLFVCRRTPEAIRILGGRNKMTIAADNTVTKVEIPNDDRIPPLVSEFGISEEIACALPPDTEKGFSLA